MPDLSTRTARRRLPPGPEKRWVRLARGRALGYRRPGAEAGIWYVRVYAGGGAYRMATLGTADDTADADNETILSYGQASTQAVHWNPDEEALPRKRDAVTVREAVEHYLDWYHAHRKAFDRIRSVFDAHILPELGDLRIDTLSARRIRCWHQSLAEKPARLRGGQLREARTEDEKRARKATANHALTALKAALNRAADEGSGEGPRPWSKVKAFRGVDAARVRYLEQAELERLLNTCSLDFRDLVTAAVHTGARYGELASLMVGDYLPETKAVHFTSTKTGDARHVYLSDEGAAFFDRLTAGRGPGECLLTKADETAWGRNHQSRPMRAACQAAQIEPPVGFHQLRHSYASIYLMSGGSLVALAKQLGHTTTRMVEKHYGHLSDAWRAEEARKHAPRLGRKSRVTRLRRASRA